MEPNKDENIGKGEVNVSGSLIPKEFAEKDGKEFLADELHKKAKLSSLRSYQSDMAEFIKEKNESVLSIAAKEKKRKDEEKAVQEKLEIKEKPKKETSGMQINFSMLLSSGLLLAGGAVAIFFVYNVITRTPSTTEVAKNQILPFNHEINLANSSKETLDIEIAKITPENGITEIKISDANGKSISSAQDFLRLVKAEVPATLDRNLLKDFAIGLYSRGEEKGKFIIIKVSDFGLAFSSMLEWEKNISKDLSLLATPLFPSTEAVWSDIIIKNKDARVLSDKQNKSILGYAFLDKNTILILDNVYVLSELSDAYSSRSFTR